MPYKVEKRSGPRPWKIINLDRNEVVGSSTSKEQAQSSVRARYHAEGGGKFTRTKKRRKS